MNRLSAAQCALIRCLGRGTIIEVASKNSEFDFRTFRALIDQKVLVYLKNQKRYQLTKRGMRLYKKCVSPRRKSTYMRQEIFEDIGY